MDMITGYFERFMIWLRKLFARSQVTMITALPQNDPDPAKRAADLAASQGIYVATLDKVPGLPMIAKVPEASSPSAAWMLAAAGPLLTIVANIAANQVRDAINDATATVKKHAPPKANLKLEFKGFIFGEERSYQLETKDIHNVVSGVEKLLSGKRSLIIDGEKELKNPWSSPLAPNGRPTSVASYNSLYKDLIHPPAMAAWNEDSWFASMRVAGQNPLLITAMTELPGHFPVTEADYAKTAVTGDSLATALAEGRLFIADYRIVGEIVKDNPAPAVGDYKYTPSPMALFGVRPDKGTLHPIAIQAGQDPKKFGIITPAQGNTADGWLWRCAKTAVQVADANYHELIAHLGRTHLITEAVILASARHLAPEHPLTKLLMPHFEGTLAINSSAASNMLSPGGAIDLSFGGTLDSMIDLAVHGVSDFDFHGCMPPADFARRGVGPDSRLIDYPFRDDALRIWKAISDWATAYVDVYYDDAAIAADTELAAWSAALCAPINAGGVAGFKPITDKAILANSLAMIMFTSSAQHAAVNFPQWSDMSYSPALAGALWSQWKEGELTEQDWLNLLPPLQFGELQAEFMALLGGVNHTRLGEYKTAAFPYPDSITDAKIIDGPLAAFKTALRSIESDIAQDNIDLKNRSVAYTHLLPSRIPASINI